MATKKKPTTKAKTKTARKVSKPATKKKIASTKTASTKSTKNKKIVKKPAAKITTKKSKANSPIQQLVKLNMFGALLCAALAGVVFTFGNDLIVGITSNYLAENSLTNSGDLLPALRELFRVNLTYVIIGVLSVAALWRVLILSKLSATYQQQVTKKFTSSNWFEFALLGPWIVVIVAASIGVRDVASLLLIAGSVAGVSLLGYLTDRYNLIGKSTVQKQVIITKALLLPWAVIGISVWHTYLYGFVTLNTTVYALLVASFLVYLLIAFAHRRQITATGRFKDFMFSEKVVLDSQLVLYVLLASLAFA